MNNCISIMLGETASCFIRASIKRSIFLPIKTSGDLDYSGQKVLFFII